MDEEKKPSFLKVASKLYLTINIISVIVLMFFGVEDLIKEIDKKKIFTRVHENLEKLTGITPNNGSNSLEEDREKLKNDYLSTQLDLTPPPEDKTIAKLYKVIDETCFDKFGNILEKTSKERCHHLMEFSQGKPFSTINLYFFLSFLLSLGFYLLKRWATWLIK